MTHDPHKGRTPTGLIIDRSTPGLIDMRFTYKEDGPIRRLKNRRMLARALRHDRAEERGIEQGR